MLTLFVRDEDQAVEALDLLSSTSVRPIKIIFAAAAFRISRKVLKEKIAFDYKWTNELHVLSVEYGGHTIQAVSIGQLKGRSCDVLVVIEEGVPAEILEGLR